MSTKQIIYFVALSLSALVLAILLVQVVNPGIQGQLDSLSGPSLPHRAAPIASSSTNRIVLQTPSSASGTTGEIKNGPTPSPRYSTDFEYPYPLSWESGGIKFDLIGITLGAPPVDFVKGTALTLKFKIHNDSDTDSNYCKFSVKRLINEEGDFLPFSVGKTYGCGLGAYLTHFDDYYSALDSYKPSDKEFILNISDGSSNFFLIVTLQADRFTAQRADQNPGN